MKQAKFATLLLVSVLFARGAVWAQKEEGHGHVTLIKKNATLISIGGGTVIPGADAKDSARLANSIGINLDVYLPILKKEKFTLGLNGGGEYSFSNHDPLGTVPAPFNVLGQSSVAVTTTGSVKNSGFKAGIGPQLNLYIGRHLLVSPAFRVGYMSLTQKEFSAIQTTSINGKTYDFTLLGQSETKTSGLAIDPRIRLQYFFTERIGIWAEGSYTIGPSIKNSVSTFTPLGPVGPTGAYELQQLQQGITQTVEKSTAYTALGVSGGLVFAFGGGKTEHLKKKDHTVGAIRETRNDTRPPDKNRNCKTYKAPVITSPAQGDLVQVNRGNLQIRFVPSDALGAGYRVFVWRSSGEKRVLIHEKVYPAGFNGTITGLNISDKKTEEYWVQMQAVEGRSNLKTDKAVFQKSSCAVFENNGFSNTASFSSSTSCAANYSFSIDSARCIEGKKVKVYCHVKFDNLNAIPSPMPTLSNATFVDDVTNLPISTSGFVPSITPLSLLPSNTDIPFSFDATGETCDKRIRITYDINWSCPSGPQHIIACVDTFTLPCCYCSYCDKPENMNIQNISGSASTVAVDNLNVLEQFNVSPKNISAITAEIVYMEEDTALNAACKQCRKAENEVYHFIGTNTAAWNASPATNATAGNSAASYPTKILNWSTNAQGNVSFNLTIGLPGTAPLSCCERHGKVCIRYSFTDVECKTCNQLVCYTY